MDTSDDKDMLMRKLAIYEFGRRNILYFMFESLFISCLYQERLIETICYSEIVKPNILKKLKQRKKKRKKKEVWVKHQSLFCFHQCSHFFFFFFHGTIQHSNFVIFVVVLINYACANSSIDQAE